MGYGAAPVAEPPIKKISVKEAARCMGKSDQFVRIGLQRGLLPFGNAVPGTGACWNYYINPTKFRDYVGADQFNSFFGLTAERGTPMDNTRDELLDLIRNATNIDMICFFALIYRGCAPIPPPTRLTPPVAN